MTASVLIESRFRGFEDVAQGGYSAGTLAGFLGGPAAVTLRGPVPMDVPLRVEEGEGRCALLAGEQVLAEARPAELELEPPRRVSPGEAEEISRSYPGFGRHPFPGCFCCGPEREAGDGLRIFPGLLDAGAAVAAAWTPDPGLAGADGAVRPEIVWAAFDCPQLWALIASAPRDSTDRVVTARLETELRRPLPAGERCAVLAWPLGVEGRWHTAGAALLDEDGEVLAVSRQTAATAPIGVPLGLANFDR